MFDLIASAFFLILAYKVKTCNCCIKIFLYLESISYLIWYTYSITPTACLANFNTGIDILAALVLLDTIYDKKRGCQF